ncbi:hypothetical protein PG994_012594 [Apiospora phragmitis]|uniref:F-box domain-containing protein n=1 Tax=Apiospora phragmitis TaxID=2905665 RepID=A0ABR1TAW2_9PEZI
MDLLRLPGELIHQVSRLVDLQDLMNLSSANSQFRRHLAPIIFHTIRFTNLQADKDAITHVVSQYGAHARKLHLDFHLRPDKPQDGANADEIPETLAGTILPDFTVQLLSGRTLPGILSLSVKFVSIDDYSIPTEILVKRRPLIRQSQPIDTTKPVRPEDVRGRTILITGGASGFGASFARHWAAHGAHVIIGDVQDAVGEALVAELRASDGVSSPHQHYRHCDVTSWESQAAFFREAVALSPHGGLDAVVANAGISDTDFSFCRAGEKKRGESDDNSSPCPGKPDLKCLDVNLVGAAYTAHLAMYWLSRNPGSTAHDLGKPRTPAGPTTRDRHLLLVGSAASLWPVAQSTQYTMSKHAVLGLFRSLRGMAGWQSGVDAAVEAATRFMADAGIVGRALVVGPRVRVRDDGETYEVMEILEGTGENAQKEEEEQKKKNNAEDGFVTSSWEAYAHDYELVEVTNRRILMMLNQIETMRKWAGWVRDIVVVVGMILGLVRD